MAKYVLHDERDADVGNADSIGKAIDVGLGRLRAGIGRKIRITADEPGGRSVLVGSLRLDPIGDRRATVTISVYAEVDAEV